MTASSKIDPRKHMREDPLARPMSPEEEQALYLWSGDEDDCPDNLYVNAGAQPLIIGAQARVPFDNTKIMPGDRAMGSFYDEVARNPMFTGLMRLKDLPIQRRVELAQQRKLRLGEEPPQWVKDAWGKLPKEARDEIEKTSGKVE